MKLFEKHKCLEKNCQFLKKFEEYPFWVKQANRQRDKENKRAKANRAKARKTAEQAAVESRTALLKTVAQETAVRLGFPIIITRVSSQADRKGYYIINYVSEERHPDWSDYFDLALEMRRQFGGKYTLRHVRSISGRFMTISEWEEATGKMTGRSKKHREWAKGLRRTILPLLVCH
ncbi:MAG: hypothetical protein J1E06_04080 [Acutalibacter sp.]|nr:hypothetical protein [Acutalibacter sp.]